MSKFNEIESFNKNLEAIKLLKELEKQERLATPEEMEILKQYIGWGGVFNVFPNMDGEFLTSGWESRNEQLKEILSEDEYIKVLASINDAFYTPSLIIQTAWQAVHRMGLRGGIALEPSCGTGRFIYENKAAENYKFIGVENDSITARIAKHLVNDQAYIFETGFENLDFPTGFDLVIGNPPYGNVSLNFKNKEYYSYSIHNQFILNTLNKLNHEGIACFVVSRYVMDSQSSSARYEMSKLARLVGAIRLPSSTFGETNTDVVTDILLFKRHSASEEYAIKKDIDNFVYNAPTWVNNLNNIVCDEMEDTGDQVKINSFFYEDGVIAGQVGVKKSQFGYTLDIADSGSLEDELSAWVGGLPEGEEKLLDKLKMGALYESFIAHLYINMSGKEIGILSRDETGSLYRIIEQDSEYGILYKTDFLSSDSVWSDKYRLDYLNGYYEKIPLIDELGEKVYKLDDKGFPTNQLEYEHKYVSLDEINPRSKLGVNRLDKLEKLIDIRDILLEQIERESQEYSDEKIEENRQLLKAAYDKFVKKHGYINNPSNTTLITDLPDAGLLLSLEYDYRNAVKVDDGFTPSGNKKYKITKPETAKESAILSKRVIYKTCVPDHANDSKHALALSMNQKGKVCLDYMAELCNTDQQSIINELFSNTSEPSIFFDHKTNCWVHKSSYLSGNVRAKLTYAMAADDDIAIKALNTVIPERISIENIGINIGAKWIPEHIYLSFIKFMTEDDKATISYHDVANCYDIECSPSVAKESIYATEKVTLKRIIDSLLNSATIRVTKTIIDYQGNEKSVFDQEATELVMINADNIKLEFNEWLFNQIDYLEELENIYNEKFNSFITPKFDGSDLIILDKVPDDIIKLRQHQLDVIYRGIVTNTLLGDHCVGAGKTYEMIAIAMMRKKLGLSTKSMIVVPNHLIEQFAADTYRIFPSARILAAGAKDFEKKKRRRILARIATGDFDLVIVPHSSFEFIKLSDEIQSKFINEEIKKVEKALLLKEKNFSSRSAKTLQQKLKRLERQLKGAINENRNDRLISFDQLGITHLAVDEADLFKNVPFNTNMRNVVGLGNPIGSNRAMDLYLKVKWLKSINGSINYFTGTSISNSGVEMFLLMRSLIGEVLDDLGLGEFDNWANFFAENGTKFEASESGKLKQVTRFAREWRNMRTLMTLWYQFTDAITSDDIKRVYKEQTGKKFPIADLIGGQRQSIIVEPNQEQQQLLDEVLERYENLDSISNTEQRNAERLRLMDIAKKLSLAARCVDPVRFSAETGGKVEAMADNIFKIYQEWDEHKGTQLVFFDRSVPRKKSDSKVLKVYDNLKAKLEEAIQSDDERLIQIYEDKLDQYNESEIESIRFSQNTGWSIYQELKDLLVERGMEPSQVRFIQEANNDKQKKELFNLVKTGEVRVLIGSTHLMGAGTNVQNRLVHLHHGDVTWRPRDLEQREGRLIRQGSDLLEEIGQDKFKVGITCYVTKYSMDAKLFEVNSAKLKMISAIRKYSGEHSFDFGEDADTVTLQEIAAIATGNPLMLERVVLDVEIKKLERLYSSHIRKQSSMTLQVKRFEGMLIDLPVEYDLLNKIAVDVKKRYLVAKEKMDQSYLVINGHRFKDVESALAQLNQLKEKKQPIKINGAVERLSSAKKIVEKTLNKNVFEMKVDNQYFDNALDAAERVYSKIGKNKYGDIKVGELFGLPVYAEIIGLGGLEYSILSSDEQNIIATFKSNYTTVINVPNIAGHLLKLMKDLFLTLKEREKIPQKIESAKSTIAQIEPFLGIAFKQQPELDLKRKRLSLVVKALQEDNADVAISRLMAEHKDEMDMLQLKVDMMNPDYLASLNNEPEKRGRKPKDMTSCKVVVDGKLVRTEQMALF